MASKIKTTVDLQNPSDDHEELVIKRAKEDFELAEAHWN